MLRLIFTCFILFNMSCAFAVDPSDNWKTIKTNHFYIHYIQGEEVLANKAAIFAEHAHEKLSPAINWKPAEKTHLIISDENDQPNGFAFPFPFNRSVIFATPPDTTNSLEDYDDWLDTLITHEYTHILHLDKNTGATSRLRKLFGRHFLLFPNLYQPIWLIEGLATYHETDNKLGIGRGQSNLFKMMMRIEVANGIKPLNQVNLSIRSWPIGTTAYLYGVHFYQFIENKYGKNAIKELIHNYSNNVIPYMINTNSREVLQKDLSELWDEFRQWLIINYPSQKPTPNTNDLDEGQKLTNNGYFTGGVRTLSKETYYVRQGPFSYQALMKINVINEHEEITELHRNARIDVHKKNGVLIAQPEYCNEHKITYDLYVLKHSDTELTKITECGQYRSASWAKDGSSILAVHINNGISQLHILKAHGKKPSIIWQGKSNEVIGQPDWSNNGKHIVASIFRPGTGWNIELFNLTTKKWKKITRDAYIDTHPQFSDMGNSIVFSSDRTGIYNIYRYEFANKKITQLTKVKGGAFQPSQLNKHNPLYYVHYSSNGYDISRLNKPLNLTTSINATSVVKKSPIDKYPGVAITDAQDYSPLSSLRPRWWFPYFLLDENQNELGFTTASSDALGIHNYIFQLAYDTENDYPIGRMNYSYSHLFHLGIRRSTDINLDTSGNFLKSLTDDEAFIVLNFPFTQIKSRWSFLMGAITSKLSDARLSSSALLPTDFNDNILAGALTYTNSKYYIRSISQNNGRSLRFVAESSDLFNSDFSGETYTLDWREYLPLGGQHVLALRFAEGYGNKLPKPFILGGEKNEINALDIIFNSIDSDPIFNKREYTLRGYAQGHPQLINRRMQLASLEWRFPLDLVERGFMTPPLGLIQYSGSLFIDKGAVWFSGRSPDDYYTGVGMELHADISIFYALNLRMRLGLAKGLDDQIGENRIYFSLGSSF